MDVSLALLVAAAALLGFAASPLVTTVSSRILDTRLTNGQNYATVSACVILCALTAWRVGFDVALPTYLYLACVAVALTIIDIAAHRLPDALTLPSYGILTALLVFASLVEGEWGAFWRALVCAALLFGAYYVLALISPASMGFGDVKLAGVLGLSLGWLSWFAPLYGTIAAFTLGGLTSLGLLLAGRVTLRSHIPFGPFMLAGALLVVLLA